MPSLLDHIQTTTAGTARTYRTRRRHWRAVAIVVTALLVTTALVLLGVR